MEISCKLMPNWKKEKKTNFGESYVEVRIPPVFCELCPSLALIIIEDVALCKACMLERIKGQAKEWILNNARALVVVPPMANPSEQTVSYGLHKK